MAKSKNEHSVDQLPKLNVEFLLLPDEEIGRLVLSTYIESWATNRDLSSADSTADIVDEVLAEIEKGIISNIQYLALDKALKIAATGDLSSAGNWAKQHFLRLEFNSFVLQVLAHMERLRLKGPKKGGQVSAATRRANVAERNKKICESAIEMKQAGKSPKNVPGLLAIRYGLTARHIRNILTPGKKNQ